MWALAIIGVLTSVVGAFYYIRIVKVMYFDAPVEAFDRRAPSVSFVAAVSGLFTDVLLHLPRPVHWCGAGRGQGAVRMSGAAHLARLRERSTSVARRVRVVRPAAPSPASQWLRDLSRIVRERCTAGEV